MYKHPIHPGIDYNEGISRQGLPNGEFAGSDGRPYDAQEFSDDLRPYFQHVCRQLAKNRKNIWSEVANEICSYPEKKTYLIELSRVIENNDIDEVYNKIKEGLYKFVPGEDYKAFNKTLATILLKHGARLERVNQPTELRTFYTNVSR